MRTFEKFIVEAEGFQGKMTPDHNAKKGAIAVKNLLDNKPKKPKFSPAVARAKSDPLKRAYNAGKQKALPADKGSAIVPTGQQRTSREAVGKVTSNPGVRVPQSSSSGPTKTPNMNPKPKNGFKSKPGLGTTLGSSTSKRKGDSFRDRVSQMMRSRKAAKTMRPDKTSEKTPPSSSPKPTATTSRSSKDAKSNGSGKGDAYDRQIERERAKEDYAKGTHHKPGDKKKPGIRAGLKKGAFGDWSRQGKFDMAKKVGTAARNAPGKAVSKGTDMVKNALRNNVKDVKSVEGKEGKSSGRMQKQY